MLSVKKWPKILQITAMAGLVFLTMQVTARAADKAGPSDSFELGVTGQYYQYREPDFAKLQGYGGGLDGTYTYNWSTYFLRANIIADFYSLDYSSNGTGTESGVNDFKQDYRGMFGYNWKVAKGKATISPYVGLGYRMLFDANGENITSTGAGGYDRRSQYLYAPIGVGFAFNAGHWGFRTFAEYDYLVHGWQTSYLRDIGFDNNIKNDQSAGYGLRGSIMVAPPINFYNLSFGPYVRYWNIHESNQQPLYLGGVEVGTALEPQNNTLEMGLEASIRFK